MIPTPDEGSSGVFFLRNFPFFPVATGVFLCYNGGDFFERLHKMLKQYILIFLVSMVPLIELRLAVPMAASMGLNYWTSLIVCVIGNMLPVPIIYLFARKVLLWGAEKKFIGKFFTYCLTKGERGGQKLVAKTGRGGLFVALMLFVGIPLPGTGARQRNAHEEHQRNEQTAAAGFCHQLLTAALTLGEAVGEKFADEFLLRAPEENLAGEEVDDGHREHIADDTDNQGSPIVKAHAGGHRDCQTQFNKGYHGYQENQNILFKHFVQPFKEIAPIVA